MEAAGSSETTRPRSRSRGRQHSKKPDSSARKVLPSARITRSQSRGRSLQKDVIKSADVDDDEENGWKRAEGVTSEAQDMEIEKELSRKLKGKGRAITDDEMEVDGEVDELDEDDDEIMTAKTKPGKRRSVKAEKEKDPVPKVGRMGGKRRRDGKNPQGYVINQFYPNPCWGCVRMDHPCVASRSEMCQRCKKAKTRCDRDRIPAPDGTPHVFGRFEKGWDQPPVVAEPLPSGSQPATRTRTKRHREMDSEEERNSSVPPSPNPAKRRRSVSSKSHAETEAGSAVPPPSSESESSKGPTEAGKVQIPYVVVPTAQEGP